MSEISGFLEQFADLIATKLAAQLQSNHGSTIGQRLLTVDQVAICIGRTRDAAQFLVASGKLPSVRSDRRVFLDIRDLDQWIEHNKSNADWSWQ